MCYKLLIIKKYCDDSHVIDAEMCWRQCRQTAAVSDVTRDWNYLCTASYSERHVLRIWCKLDEEEIIRCEVCLALEAHQDAREIKEVLRKQKEFQTEYEVKIEELIEEQMQLEQTLKNTSGDEAVALRCDIKYLAACEIAVARKEMFNSQFLSNLRGKYREIENTIEGKAFPPMLQKTSQELSKRRKIYFGAVKFPENQRPDHPHHRMTCDPVGHPHEIFDGGAIF